MVIFEADDPTFIPRPPDVQLGGQLVVGLADSGEIGSDGALYRTLGIFLHSIPPGSTMDETMEEAYRFVKRDKGWLDATGPVTLAGLAAFQQTYGIFDYASQSPYVMRDIWTEKDGMAIRVSIWMAFNNPENLAAFQSLADQILGTLVIKDNLPPIVETPTLRPTPSPLRFRLPCCFILKTMLWFSITRKGRSFIPRMTGLCLLPGH